MFKITKEYLEELIQYGHKELYKANQIINDIEDKVNLKFLLFCFYFLESFFYNF